MDSSFDIESLEIEPPARAAAAAAAPRAPTRRATRTSRLVTHEVRAMIAQAYRGEVASMIRWRDLWKKFGDACEAIAKGLTGASAVLAFAASAVRDTKTADILSFTSGTVSTVGLVLLAYSSYAVKESRQRTNELNGLLDSIGVTPMPDIAPVDSSARDE